MYVGLDRTKEYKNGVLSKHAVFYFDLKIILNSKVFLFEANFWFKDESEV